VTKSPGQMKGERNRSMVAGLYLEEEVFNRIMETLEKLQVQDTVVINGLRRRSYQFDFVIVSYQLNTIFVFEIKNDLTHDTQNKLLEQLNRGLKFFESAFRFPPEEKWNLICLGYVNQQKTKSVCHISERFVLGPETNLELWWQEMTALLQPRCSKASRKTYIDLIKVVLGGIDMATEGQLVQATVDNINKMLSIKNLFSLEKTGKKVALLPSLYSISFILLKKHAKDLLARGKTVVIVLFADAVDSLKIKKYQKEFNNLCEIQVLLYSGDYLFHNLYKYG
jgi:hypothetical protein